jgi:hypothetical protein
MNRSRRILFMNAYKERTDRLIQLFLVVGIVYLANQEKLKGSGLVGLILLCYGGKDLRSLALVLSMVMSAISASRHPKFRRA